MEEVGEAVAKAHNAYICSDIYNSTIKFKTARKEKTALLYLYHHQPLNIVNIVNMTSLYCYYGQISL